MGASSLRKSGYRFANRMEAFLIRWDDLLMGGAVLLSLTGMMLSIMVMREYLDWTLMLGWLPVLVFFVLRFGSGEDLRRRQLGNLAQEGFRVDDEIVGSQNGVAFDTGGRQIAFIPYTRTGALGIYTYDDVEAVRFDYRDGALGRVQQSVTFRLSDPRAPAVEVAGSEAVYARINALLERKTAG
jgi:hypothetical protein